MIEEFAKSNGRGWVLSLRRTSDPEVLVAGRNPLLIIPGYGMNSFIFGFHPSGTSMEGYLASRGFEVWSVDLRAQGKSERSGAGRADRYGLSELILEDVASAVDGVLEHTQTETNRVDMIGCSLGATMMFAYAACVVCNRAGRLVNMGGPVRLVKINPIFKLLFSSPRLVGMLPIRGARKLCGTALPLLEKVPWLLSIYIHPDIVDMTQAAELVRTVEDPSRHVNREIARWIKREDLFIAGKNVSVSVQQIDNPLLTVLANADGLVPRECVLWPHEHIGGERRDLLEVGTQDIPIAHADMFVSEHAPAMVFEPLARWLEAA